MVDVVSSKYGYNYVIKIAFVLPQNGLRIEIRVEMDMKRGWAHHGWSSHVSDVFIRYYVHKIGQYFGNMEWYYVL